MAQASTQPSAGGQTQIPPDIREWGADLRHNASLVVLALAGLFLVGALVYWFVNAAGSGWFLWVSIVVLVLLLLAEAAIVATGIAREEGGPAWLAGTQASPAAQAGAAQQPPAAEQEAPPEPDEQAHPDHEHVHIDLKCPECAELFSVHDTGERPLHTECPHCGAEGHVDLEAPPPESVHDREPEPPAQATAEQQPPPATDAPAPDHEELSLKCPACATEFSVTDTGARPLEAECPGCGRSGKLK